jgi:putative ABC transport system permease protein
MSRLERRLSRIAAMAALGIRMMLHDRLKLAGTLIGVVFAVVLSGQQLGTFLGLLEKNTMFVDQTETDLWILPAATETLGGGARLSTTALTQARSAEGVAWAEPLLEGTAAVALLDGGSEPVHLIGARHGRWAGGPWNLVEGDVGALARPDTVIFEDSQRESLGGLNVGSRREMNGHLVTAGGFTWGLLPFGPSYAFAEYDTARLLLGTPSDRTSYVLVGLAPGADVDVVRAALASRVPDAEVKTTAEFRGDILTDLLTKTPMGITFGMSTAFGLIVGFVIVALLLFSAVVERLREFGTLKAVGVTNGDLGWLLGAQSITYATFGSAIGLYLLTRMGEAMRSPEIALILPSWLLGAVIASTVVLCVLASGLALLRVRSVEPGMVFR